MFFIFTACKRSLQRLCFHRCLSVHRGVVCPIACWDTPPFWQTAPWADTRQTPLGRHPHPGQTTPYTVHAGIQSTSRQYTSHWNAFLFKIQINTVFTCVCLSTEGVCVAGGHAWWGVHDRGCAWQGGMCDRGVCMAGGMHGRAAWM